MSIDIWSSRRGCFEECKWWNRDETIEDNDKLIHNEQPDGIFFAKEYSAEVRDSAIVGGVFMFDRTSVTLRTADNLEGMKKNALVLYQGEKWIVDNIQKKQIRSKSTEFASDRNVSHWWVIALRK